MKCTFGLESGRFLSYLVTHKGIEANPEQLRAILNLQPPRTIKDTQSLTSRVAALNSFISQSSHKCKLFYNILKKSEKNKEFEWTEELQQVFDQLKAYLVSPTLLSKPVEGEDLYLYMAVTDTSVSAVLIREDSDKLLPIFYISKTLLDAETRYTPLQKLILSLVITSIK